MRSIETLLNKAIQPISGSGAKQAIGNRTKETRSRRYPLL
jgi:hypothetical protein